MQSKDYISDLLCEEAPSVANRIILHAQPGWGKTSLAAQIPDVCFMMSRNETGLLTLMGYNQVGKTKYIRQSKQRKDFES